MKKPKESTYSVAMSKETGAIVMLRTNGKKVSVIGSMSREDSLGFVEGIMKWSASTIREEGPRIMLPH
jgi:hypothetical protein